MTHENHDPCRIEDILPHRPPFLFVDRVCAFQPGKEIVAEKHLNEDEGFFRGHFPGRPIMPGVLVTEALAQTGGLLLGLTLRDSPAAGEPPPADLFLASVDVKFLSPAVPGDTLRLKAALKKRFGPLALFKVRAEVNGRLVAKGTISLGAGSG